MIVYDEDNDGSPKYIKEQASQLALKQVYPIITINAYDLQSIAEDEQQDFY
ncbi:hypothetical protein D3C71_1980330 [compost metagenome]